MYATGIHHDALELARLLKPSWPAITEGIARSGVPTCLRDEDALKEKLRKVEEQLAAARDERVALVKARDEARAAFAGSESMSQDSDEFKAAQGAVAKVGEIDDRIADLQAQQVTTLQLLGKDAQAAERRPNGETHTADDQEWNSRALMANDELRAMLAQASASKARFGGIEIGQVATRDALVADITGTTGMRKGSWAGVIPQLRRRLSVLDLLPTGTMDNNTFPYTKESGSFGTAVETAEGIAKAEAALTLTDDRALAEDPQAGALRRAGAAGDHRRPTALRRPAPPRGTDPQRRRLRREHPRHPADVRDRRGHVHRGRADHRPDPQGDHHGVPR
jgi:hypothetical protein